METLKDRFLFRVLDKERNQICKVCNIDYRKNEVELSNGYVTFWKSFEDVVLMQCTGLRDNTKWEQLSLKEQQAFYKEMIIKNPNLNIKKEDVHEYWMGQLIYEGDIISDKYELETMKGEKTGKFEECRYVVEWNIDGWQVRLIYSSRYQINNETYKGIEIAIKEYPLIGNIYENPELLTEVMNNEY